MLWRGKLHRFEAAAVHLRQLQGVVFRHFRTNPPGRPADPGVGLRIFRLHLLDHVLGECGYGPDSFSGHAGRGIATPYARAA
jgi:hypothetical protein